MFGLTGWVNNVAEGALNVATGGASGIIDNAVQKIQEGKPLDALAGVITGGPVGVATGVAQTIGGIVEGATGDKTISQAVAGVKEQLNTFTGAAGFALAAITAGAVAGGKELPKIPGAKAPTNAKAAPVQAPSGKTLEVLTAGKTAAAPTTSGAPKKKRGRIAIAATVGVGILGALVAAFTG